MKINSTHTAVVASGVASQSAPLDKHGRQIVPYDSQSSQVLASSNVSKRALDHSMIAYSKKMQDIAALRRNRFTTTSTQIGIQTGETQQQQPRVNLGRTISWLDPSTSTSVNIANVQQHTVGRKWATLNKLRKPNDSSLKSISDSVWQYQDINKALPHCGGASTIVDSKTAKDIPTGGAIAKLDRIKDRPRSRSVLDLVVRNHTDTVSADKTAVAESPQTRPSSEQGHVIPAETHHVIYPGSLPVHANGFRGRGYFNAIETSIWDNPKLRSETNVLTLPDINDTVSEISATGSSMDINSSVQIVPFPVSELQAVPAKLHHSGPLIPVQISPRKVDTKSKHSTSKLLSTKDIKHGTVTDKNSPRVPQHNHDKNAKISNGKTMVSPRVTKLKGGDKGVKPIHSPVSGHHVGKVSKESPRYKDMTKDSIGKTKTKSKSPPLLKAHNANTETSTIAAVQNGAPPKNGLSREQNLDSDSVDSHSNSTKHTDSPSPKTHIKLPTASKPTPLLSSSPDAKQQIHAVPDLLLGDVTENTHGDDDTQSTASSTIRSVLKKQIPKSQQGDNNKKPKAPKKTVQFGPKLIKEVTKIVYPWNEHSSSDEETMDEVSEDDDEEDEEEEDDTDSDE